ncbi:MAG: response regulator transcription factor [Anaerolineales bacterium]|nr:MAG: response regulator transcription factor [Anaerolineales bacterium]
MSKIRLLIADDHPVVRDGLRGMLSSQPDFEIVGEATNGEEAVQLTKALQPEVVLMDLRMPIMDGVTAIGEIKFNQPEIQVLVLTTYDSDADILPAVEAGATGYLLKDSSREELYAAIRATARGESVLTPTVATRLLERMRAPAEENLSEREREVLQLVAEGASNSEIASHLHISQATVKSHLIHVFGKLGVSDRTAAVTVALQRGILRLEP